MSHENLLDGPAPTLLPADGPDADARAALSSGSKIVRQVATLEVRHRANYAIALAKPAKLFVDDSGRPPRVVPDCRDSQPDRQVLHRIISGPPPSHPPHPRS